MNTFSKQNIIASNLLTLSSLGILGIGLWGGDFIVIIISVVSLVSSYFLYKGNTVGKWSSLISVCIPLIFFLKVIISAINEARITPFESWEMWSSFYFLGIPLIYLFVTFVFILKSNPKHK